MKNFIVCLSSNLVSFSRKCVNVVTRSHMTLGSIRLGCHSTHLNRPPDHCADIFSLQGCIRSVSVTNWLTWNKLTIQGATELQYQHARAMENNNQPHRSVSLPVPLHGAQSPHSMPGNRARWWHCLDFESCVNLFAFIQSYGSTPRSKLLDERPIYHINAVRGR